MDDQWGVGNKAQDKAFDTTLVGKDRVDLVWGEHPHSRSDNNIYARWPDGRIEGFAGHRLLIGVRIEPYNYLKTSHLSGNEVRKGGHCKLSFNGEDVYEFFFRDIQGALLEAHRLIGVLSEHPVRLWRWREDLIGRKIYYHRQPAKVTNYFPDQGAVIILFEPGFSMPRSPYDIEENKEGYWAGESYVKDHFLSPHIWWFREDKKDAR